MSALFEKRKINTIVTAAVILLMTFFMGMRSEASLWFGGLTPNDHLVFKYIGYAMTKGQIPYRDLFDHKGPYMFLLNHIGVSISPYYGIWLIEILAIFITFLVSYKLARLLDVNSVYSLVIVFVSGSIWSECFESGDFVEEFALPLITIALYFFIDYLVNNNISIWRIVLSGFAFGVVFLLRANMIAVWFVFCTVIAIKLIINKNWEILFKFILHFTIGFVIAVLPVIIYLWTNGALRDFYYDYVVFNAMYSSTSEWVDGYKRVHSFLFILNKPWCLIAIIILGYLISRKKDTLCTLTYCAYVFVSMLTISMSGQIYTHYFIVLVTILIYPLAELMSIISDMNKGFIWLLIGYLAVTIAFPNWNNAVDLAAYKYMKRGEVHFDDNLVAVTDYIKKETDDQDTISVFGSLDSIYLLSERISASKYSYQFPVGEIDKSIMDEYFSEIEANKPRIIVVTEQVKNNERMNKFLSENYYELVFTRIGYAEVYLLNDLSGGYHISGFKKDFMISTYDNDLKMSYTDKSLFRLEKAGDGLYYIYDDETGKVISAPTESEAGCKVELAEFNNSDNQKWRLQKVKKKTYKIYSVLTDYVLDIEGASDVEGAQVILWQEGDEPNQLFKLIKE